MTGPGIARAAAFLAAVAAVPLVFTDNWVATIGIFTLMFAGLASAWNLVGGYAGYPSLGHAAFFGCGAYAFARLAGDEPLSNGYTPLLWLPVVGVAVALVGLPVAAIAMRTRADVFAIVTIAVLFIAQTLAFNLPWLTGGSQGIAIGAPPFSPDTYERPFYYAMLALLALTLLISWAVARSKVGLSLAAVRADEDKAVGIGVPVATVKLLAFCLSVGLTAMFGGVWAYYVAFIYPQFAVDPLITLAMVLMAFLGGRATLWGPVLGAFLLAPGQQYLAYRLGGSQLYLLAYAGIFLVTMLLLPRGVLPTLADVRRRRRRRAAPATPEPLVRTEVPV